MSNKESVLKPVRKLKGGARLPHNKATAELPSVNIKSVKQVVIPMLQHIGSPCIPSAKKGDKVFVGTLIGESNTPISAPIHASVSGEVTEITEYLLPSGAKTRAVVISSDGKMTPDPNLSPKKINTPEELASAAKDCGMVGLGGAGFPTYIKLSNTPQKPIDTLIVNAAECEPYITSDYRECMENPDDILGGIYLIKRLLNIKNVIIGVESNKPKAIKTLYGIAADRADTDNSVRLMKLKSHYPQGAEKILIYSATGRKLPLGKLPADVGCIVMNVTSIATLYRYVKTGIPLVSKRITVDGNAVSSPQNLIVPIGTRISDILDHCKAENFEKVIIGGPMMGTAVYDTQIPVTKQNNAVLAFKGKIAAHKPVTDCIRCGRCMRTCPMRLTPAAVETAVRTQDSEELRSLNVMYCMECGCCSYVCPAGRPLTVSMRTAKSIIRKAEK